MKTEISAGGLVIRKSTHRWEVLVFQDKNNAWTFPKGKLEKDEEALEAAEREIAEEVGVTDIIFLAKLPVIRYMYTRDELISKTVHYFIFTSQGKEKLINQTEEGVHNAQWMPLEKAIENIGYEKTNKPLLIETQEILAKKS